METTDFKDSVSDLAHPYWIRVTNEVTDSRECLALADLYVRIAYTLILRENHRNNRDCQRAVKAPGYGTMLGPIRAIAKSSQAKEESEIGSKLRKSAQAIVAANDRFQYDGITFKRLRDSLSHGIALPAEEGEASKLAEMLRELCWNMQKALEYPLSDLQLEFTDSSVELVSANDRLALNPMWVKCSSSEGVGLYSHSSGGSVYFVTSGGPKTQQNSISNFGTDERACLPEINNDNTLGRFVDDIIRDVGAFTEDYRPPSYYFGDNEKDGFLFVPWTRPTSERNQSRIDVFRIGKDNVYQWEHSPNDWQPYTAFLRNIANWEMLARRVRLGLEKFSSRREEEELHRLGPTSNEGVKVQPRLVEVSGDLNPNVTPRSINLVERVDDAGEVHRASTKVFLMIGAAGLGKTDLMLSAAYDRARLLEQNPNDPRPLYLFVSSTGRTLESLEDAVDSALNITKLLSNHSARALCRNGMLVMFVDGFDELLGSAGYQSALGSLEPWFRELGGRGVLVASARSSYYLSQYRRSLAERTDINADHTLVKIQPWSRSEIKDYLQRSGAQDEAWIGLSDMEWDLLGIPFFARAFAAWHSRGGRGDLPTIYDIVVEQFLDREGRKLADPHLGQNLLSHEELKNFFAEVAEYMQNEKTREIEQSELVLCAEIVVAGDLDEIRPGLSQRLTSICGLGVETSDRVSNNFSFSHEVMFDSFLSLALFRCIEDAKKMLKLLKNAKVQSPVFDWIVERGKEEALTGFSRVCAQAEDVSVGSILGENLGAWWMSLLRMYGGTPPTTAVVGLSLGRVELSDGTWYSLELRSCAVEKITVNDIGTQTVSLPDSTVGTLECEDSEKLGKAISDIVAENIGAVLTGGKFQDSPSGVRKMLVEIGLAGLDTDDFDQGSVEAAEFFLDRLIRKSLIPVVVLENGRIPSSENQELNWINHGGLENWRRFVAALERNKLAHWEPINSGGSAKVRLVPDVPFQEIRDRKSSNARVAEFWEDVRDGS